MRKYIQITIEERVRIFEFKKIGLVNNKIAWALGRNKSSISRELCRNSDHIGYLYPLDAQAATNNRKARHGPKINRIVGLREYLVKKLHECWSPESIAGRWTKEHPDNPITTETIYAFIHSRGARDLELWKLLPHKKKRRGMMRKKRDKIGIPNRVPISERPQYIEQRLEPDHFEADLFFNRGSQSANVLNVVDRKSRMTMLVKNNTKQSEPIIQHIERLIESIAKTITFDNGKEFAMHNRLRKNLGVKAYFCNPGSPWQKGSVENSNGALRRFLSFMGSSHSITQETLDRVANISTIFLENRSTF